MTNLLANPGFESDWSEEQSHRTLAIVNGAPQERIVGNIFTPPGWLTWFVHAAGMWDQPEVRDAWIQNDPRRVHGGLKGMLLFTFYRNHDAGFLQQVSVTPGQRLRLTAFAHAWSNHDEAWCTHVDDGTWSTGIGRDGVAAIEGAFPLTGKPLEDARSNFLFSVGIDPTGGANPLADTVEWGQAWHIYNEYHPLTVEAVAQAQTVTVFLRSMTLWPFKHNDAYWDDATLEVIEDVPTPPSGGLPRIQYRRVVNVVPEGAGIERALDVLVETWPQTVTNSYDDAGIGALEDKTAVLWDIPVAERQEFVDFYRQFYPGTKVQFAGTGDEPVTIWDHDITADLAHNDNCPAPLENGWWQRTLKQIDGLTFHHTLSHDPYALARSYVLKEGGRPSIPYTLWITKDGEILKCNELTDGVWHDHTGHENTHLSVGLAGNLTLVRPTSAMIDAAARVAAWAVEHPEMSITLATVKGHQDYISTACPGWQTGWKDELYQAIRDKLGVTPEPLPPPPPVQYRNYCGLHLQTMVGGWDGYVRDTGTVTKVLASMQDVIGVKRVRPDVPVIWRHVTNSYGDTLENPDPLDGARRWVDKFRDSLHIECDRMSGMGLTEPYFYVESVNEVYPPTARAVAFDRAFIQALAETGLPVAPVVMTAAVGNPHESEYSLLVPLARDCAAAGGLFGYHAYWMANRDDPDALTRHWPYLAGRWTEMDKVLVAAGVRVKWAFTEGGAVGGRVNPDGGFSLYPNDGWKANTCYGGDFTRYLADMRKFNELCAESVAGREGRVLGATLFTSGIGTGWESFQLRGPEMEAMKAL